MTISDLRNMKDWGASTFFYNLVKEKGSGVYVEDWVHRWQEGFHLMEILNLLNHNNDAKVMIVMFEYTKNEKENVNNWKIDIPGGKRYLGETSLDCAIRETEEETSVNLSKKWYTKTNIYTDVNCYFLFNPSVK